MRAKKRRLEAAPGTPPRAQRRRTRTRAPRRVRQRRFGRDATPRTPRRSGAREERRRARAPPLLKMSLSCLREAGARVPRNPRSCRAPTRPASRGTRRNVAPADIYETHPSHHARGRRGRGVRPRRASRPSRGSRGPSRARTSASRTACSRNGRPASRCRAGRFCGAVFARKMKGAGENFFAA